MNKLTCGGHVNSQMLAKKIMRQGPLLNKSKGFKRCQLHPFDGIFFQNAASCGMAGPSSIPKGTPNEKSVRRHDCCDQELLNIIENRRSQKIWWRISEPTLGSDHSRSEVLGCKDDGF